MVKETSGFTKLKKEVDVQEQAKERERIRAMNTDDSIYFNFSYTALKMLGKNLYNNPLAAISELVANGIDAKATNIYVYIDMCDKAHSVIEILDDGNGMSYDDLAEKYVWIGRNKREEDLVDTEKEMIMGRKGIGKLAALYLSNRYYIFSKKDKKETKWFLNVAAYKDSDFPKLSRLTYNKVLDTNVFWKEHTQGTAIRLDDVDLRRTGSKRIESLRRTLSDYYLLDALETKIWVAVKSKINQKITFYPVEKKIGYRNFYALFDNSEYNIAEKMRDSIAFTWTSQYPHIANRERDVCLLSSDKYQTSGYAYFHDEEGNTFLKEYKLTGWIAIHSTIEVSHALDENFMRNDVYQSNHLRIYVRRKLAVSNYFDMKKSTQTMANYIEGEISFDILDDDDLPDIATSSRQDFLDDERVDRLISLVEPIITALSKCRNDVGKEIRDENKAYAEKLLQLEQKKKEEEKVAREQAEATARKAEEARKQAEQKRQEEEQRRKRAEERADKYRAQNSNIFSAITEDQKSFTAKTHLIKTNALTIRNNVSDLSKKIDVNDFRELAAISVSTDKILSAIKYSVLAKFDLESEYIKEDLFSFVEQYVSSVLAHQYYGIDFVVNIDNEYSKRFNPQYITLILDNLVSNSKKSKSSRVTMEMYVHENCATIIYSDNGNGFDKVDKSEIFEFGISNTGGTGMGLFNIRHVVTKMNGTVVAKDGENGGAVFIITF